MIIDNWTSKEWTDLLTIFKRAPAKVEEVPVLVTLWQGITEKIQALQAAEKATAEQPPPEQSSADVKSAKSAKPKS